MNSLRNALELCAKPVIQLDKAKFSKDFFLPASFIGFEGHFPIKPVLPAIMQILMAQMTASEATGKNVGLQEMTQAKFTSPIDPDNTITCIVTQKQDSLWDCQILVKESTAAKFTWRGENI